MREWVMVAFYVGDGGESGFLFDVSMIVIPSKGDLIEYEGRTYLVVRVAWLFNLSDSKDPYEVSIRLVAS